MRKTQHCVVGIERAYSANRAIAMSGIIQIEYGANKTTFVLYDGTSNRWRNAE